MSLSFGAIDPSLTLRLQEYNLSPTYVSLIFGMQSFCEMVSTFTTPYVIPYWVEHRVTLMTFLFLLGLSTFLIGPFYGSLNLLVMLIGLFLSGLSLGPLVILNMPEMMNATAEKHPDCDMDYASSLLSGMLNCCMGIGMALGPIIGGILYEFTDF